MKIIRAQCVHNIRAIHTVPVKKKCNYGGFFLTGTVSVINTAYMSWFPRDFAAK